MGQVREGNRGRIGPQEDERAVDKIRSLKVTVRGVKSMDTWQETAGREQNETHKTTNQTARQRQTWHKLRTRQDGQGQRKKASLWENTDNWDDLEWLTDSWSASTRRDTTWEQPVPPPSVQSKSSSTHGGSKQLLGGLLVCVFFSFATRHVNGNWCRDVNVCLQWQSWTRESEMSIADISERCGQREKSAGKSSPSSSSGKSSSNGGTSRGNRDQRYCCGQVGHRRPVWQTWTFEPSVSIFWW